MTLHGNILRSTEQNRDETLPAESFVIEFHDDTGDYVGTLLWDWTDLANKNMQLSFDIDLSNDGRWIFTQPGK